MEKKRWLWKRRSSEKSLVENESSGSVSSYSDRNSDEQEVVKVSPNHSVESPEVTSKEAVREDVCSVTFNEALTPDVVSKRSSIAEDTADNSLEKDMNDTNDNAPDIREGHVNNGFKSLSEKLSAALVDVSAKEDMVKQHAKVAEEAIAGWENAENEVKVLKQQLEAASLKNSALEDRVSHLDGALKECVRQLRQTREEQERKINEAVMEKNHDLESAKLELEKQLLVLQNKANTFASSSKPQLDLAQHQKVEFLEKENLALKHELHYQSEEMEIRTIERDLSTQAAETASKQHLESIKKVAKLEAELRRLKATAYKSSTIIDHKSVAASSFCIESLTDSHSDSGERLNGLETDSQKTGCSEPKCEPSCSDSWASALIAELDQFKNEKTKILPASSHELELMDDFLEMERLAALHDSVNESCNPKSEVVPIESSNKENELKAEFDIMVRQMAELKQKLELLETQKAELEKALITSDGHSRESQGKLKEAEIKLEKLQSEIKTANESQQMIENHFLDMEEEAQNMSAKLDLIESDFERERTLSSEIASKCQVLEVELRSRIQEEKLRQAASSQMELKIKQEELAVAAGKLAECQKTIASLGNQLKSLATLEDFLIETGNIPELSSSPLSIPQNDGELWKLHSNETFSPKRVSSSCKVPDATASPLMIRSQEYSPPPSTSSPSSNHVSSEKSRNGFAKFFSRTKSGIRLEI